jgi:hypothetical protein
MTEEKKKVWWQEKIDDLERDLAIERQETIALKEAYASLKARFESTQADLRSLSENAVKEAERGDSVERSMMVATVMTTGLDEATAEAACWHFLVNDVMMRVGGPDGLAAVIRQAWDWRDSL